MKKSQLFWTVFIIATILSFLIGYSLLKESFLNAVGRDLTYNASKEIWENDYSSSMQGIVFIGSIIIGLILGGIATLFKSNKQSN